jgi:glycerol uptake facilitator-like aquaporin
MQAFVGEACAAFILMFIVCTVALDKKGDPSKIPLVMALVIPLLIYLVGPVSSMCINPARAIGPAIASGFWEHHWLWWTAPFVGGFAAVVPYKYLSSLDDQQR